MAISHVLFDLDGTLSESAPGIVGALRKALTDEGLPLPAEDALRAAVGPSFEETFPGFGVAPDRIDAVTDRYRFHYEGGDIFDTRSYPGIDALLDRLDAAGLTLAVATAKPEPAAEVVIDHLGWADRFAVVAGASLDASRRTKAAVIGHALAGLGIEPGPDVVMVGDRSHDVLGARAHGLACIAVTWGYGTEAELTAAGPAAVATTPAEVAAYVLDPPDDGPGRVATTRSGDRGQ